MKKHKRVEIIVEADVPALLFSSKRAAEQYIEPVDVENGVYPRAFDREGRIYNVVPSGHHAQLVEAGDEAKHVDDLRRVLSAFLTSVDEAVSEADNLDELLQKCDRYLDA